MKPIDFDNADLMIVGCVLIDITLIIVAGVTDVTLQDVSGLVTTFGGMAAALAHPEKVSRQVVGLLRKVPRPHPKPEAPDRKSVV